MKRLIASAVLSLSAACLVGACSGGSGTVTGQDNTDSLNGNPAGSTPPSQKTASTALFQPAAGVLPYPTDLYFAGSKDGALNLPSNPLQPNQPWLNHLDGFSTTAVIRENFAGPLNPASFTAASVIVVPVTTSNTTKATTGVLGAPLVLGTDFTVGLAPDAGVGATILQITPLHPLMPSTCIANGHFLGTSCTTGTGYLVILTNGITDASGNPAVPDTDYAAIKAALAAGGPKCPSITNSTLNGICQLTGAHLDIAQALGLNPANIVLTFSFTTESTTDTLELLSATTTPQVLKLNATGLPTSAADPALPGHSDIFVGVLTIPYYLSKSAPLTGYWQAPPFPLDPASTSVTRYNPLPVATQDLLIPVLATVPNANSLAVQAGATGPWPVLIFQHGITRSREDMLAVADSFADAGFAVVAIDLPLHGVTNTKDPLYASAANPLYAGLGLPTNEMSIERTFDLALINPPAIDPSGSHAINLTSPLTTRDGLREGVADLITFERSVAGATVVNDGGATVFVSGHTHVLGHSLGAIESTTLLAVVPATEISTGSLANPGGDLATVLNTSPTFAPTVNAGLAAQGIEAGTTLYNLFFRDIQTLWDSGDPINFVGLTVAQHPIHLMQVVGSTPPPAVCNASAPANGCPDQVVPNPTTQALITASAYGPAGAAFALTRIKASQAPLVTSAAGIRGYVNFIQGDHGSIIDDKVPAVTEEMQIEAISFTGAEIPPVITAPTTPGSTLLIADPAVIQP
jgi:pimeloyl-ACP methyl ester carboxylesterase